VHERACDRGLLEAAVDVAQLSFFGYVDNGSRRTGFELELELELDAERAARRSVHEPDEPAAGFVQQRLDYAATG
jgi:hypothetical protein